MKLAFIGLGVMGYPMAGHLTKNNFELNVFNRTTSTAEKWRSEFGQEISSSPQEVAKEADIIFICVSRDQDVEEVVCGEAGALNKAAAGSIIVDHSTVSAELARRLHKKCAERQVGFIDAPVSGGQQGAIDGKLSVMVGGDKSDIDRALPVINCYAKSITHFGGSGMGQLAKMANQICIAGILQGLSEAINFAQKAGIDIEQLVGALKQGAAQSWQLENRGVSMSQKSFNFGFAVDLMRKDLAIAINEAEKINAELPLVALVDQFYKRLQIKGEGMLDTSSLIKLLA